MPSETQTANPVSIPLLRAQVRGRVITADDPDYDKARQVASGNVDRRPAAIVRVADASDVARVVCIARDGRIPLAVRSGGHSNAGHGTVDDGIVLDLAEMKQIDIDPDLRTAWAETGLTAGEVTKAVGEHGLVVGFGDTGSVGIGGITLGGGIGYLVRKFGLTIDSLLGAEIVTADGELLSVDAEHHPDLFWAIRGGGGNFGVVTRFKFALHELPEVVGGMLLLPATGETVAGFMAAAAAAPEELSAVVNIMPAMPMPFIPEDQVGRLSIMALMCFAGDAEAGERAMAPFRALATPMADFVKPMPYAGMYPPEEGGGDYHPKIEQQTLFGDGVDRAMADRIVEHLQASDAAMRAVQLRVLGGAVERVAPDATAFAHRSQPMLGVVVTFCETEAERPRRRAWVEELAGALRGSQPGAYANFLMDEGEERVHEAYPGGTWDRLAEVKRRYDPTNLFRLNQNVPPAGGPSA